MMKGTLLLLGVLFEVIIGLAIDQARAEPQTRLYDSQGRSIGTATPYGNGSVRYYDAGARRWARPRRLATPQGSTTPAVGPSAARPPRARWHSREGSGLRASIHSDLINHRKESAVPALPAKGPGRHPFAALWQQQTNLWRKVANPAQGTTRRSPRAARSSQERPRLAGKES